MCLIRDGSEGMEGDEVNPTNDKFKLMPSDCAEHEKEYSTTDWQYVLAALHNNQFRRGMGTGSNSLCLTLQKGIAN